MLLIQLQKLVDKIFTIGFGKLRPNIRADGFSEHFNFLVSEADNLNTVVLHQLQIFLVLILCVVYAVGALLTANIHDGFLIFGRKLCKCFSLIMICVTSGLI